jgi:hypothetical protein
MSTLNVALITLPTTGNNVFRDRPENKAVEHVDLPALLLYMGQEDVEITSLDAPSVLRKLQQIRIRLIACKHTHWPSQSVDETLNMMRKEVETLLAAGLSISGQTLIPVYLGMSEPERDSEGEEPMTRADMTFLFDYFTLSGAPDAFA